MNPADEALAAHDPGLKMLAHVLNPDKVASMVDEVMPGLGVMSAQAEYVRYKPATSCLVGYRFETAQGRRTGYVKTVTCDSEPKIAKMGQRGAAVVRPDLAVSLLPRDAGLPALARFGDDLTGLLGRLGLPTPTGADVTPLAYKPERRYVGMVRSSVRPEAVLRVYAPDGYPQARQSTRCHPVHDQVATPRMLGHSDRHSSLLVSWLDGDRLAAGLGSGPGELRGEVGASLRLLHGPNGQAGVSLREAIAERILASWRAVGWLLPDIDHGPPFAPYLAASIDENRRLVPIHGDFSADQVLVGRDDGRIGVIDWDRSGRGDPIWDLACFLADLESRSLAGSLAGSTVAAWRAGLLDGYGELDDLSYLQQATAAALVARSTEPFRRRHPHWDTVMRAILDRAQHLAAT